MPIQKNIHIDSSKFLGSSENHVLELCYTSNVGALTTATFPINNNKTANKVKKIFILNLLKPHDLKNLFSPNLTKI